MKGVRTPSDVRSFAERVFNGRKKRPEEPQEEPASLHEDQREQAQEIGNVGPDDEEEGEDQYIEGDIEEVEEGVYL